MHEYRIPVNQLEETFQSEELENKTILQLIIHSLNLY